MIQSFISVGPSRLARQVIGGMMDTGRLWTLLDIMEKYGIGFLSRALCILSGVVEGLKAKRLRDGDCEIPDSLKKTLFHDLGEMYKDPATTRLTLIDFHSIIQQASDKISVDHTTLGMAQSEMQHVIDRIHQELDRWAFVPVPPGRCDYFEQIALFGDEVYARFAEAENDIRNAGSCYAVGLPTAGVFHAMRAAEHGLRYLARKLRVKLIHSGRSQKVEYADWDKVITGIRNKIDDARKLPKGPRRQAKIEHHSDAADHCLFMKDIWRNGVSHTRKPYSDTEALAAIERVRDFMKFLAN